MIFGSMLSQPLTPPGELMTLKHVAVVGTIRMVDALFPPAELCRPRKIAVKFNVRALHK